MASGVLLNIKEEVTCPICLELLTDPLSLDCGHSFCQACITANKESVNSHGENTCPVCRITYQPGDLRPNRFVSNIVERLKEVTVSPEEGQKIDLCVQHGEKLVLFCKEDGKVICWLCERSQEHRGHHTFLVEEVAQEYQEKLQAALERLRKEQKKAEVFNSYFSKEGASWKNQMQNEIQSVQNGFKQLKCILDREEQKELRKLKKEVGDILHILAKSKNELVQQSQLVRNLIADLEHRLQGSAMEMLQDVNGIMERSKTLTVMKPNTLSHERYSRALQVVDRSRILEVLNELKDV
ncbi:PREDICTED: tripartite motif-containing protein 5-like isoform X5 [Hipposideros armiger]|uniref:Tripartite motif-containing protein 5-like isoform X5 n=1 Tax=Hipposideros armiger TaxID=186990 RepID=A0A8B7TK02_HIPAR|nr:PREDICTED: tripartite motif-containing protein 5-like isoform X5 [Hipposideros armiger]XP_019523978.1 PREDICTED: tripartite motif-containing protein 5-like isoform X5 [Hipposideros armiger]XP_019523979.1 PREDICTED: tripartite motif-containing protein 5-like isoform X5 [Hipposideros armiger]XP_019523980.1 PREDICTED: tripartite motif-containing protein 5-like isoform X5 [Hipposideros armiger]